MDDTEALKASSVSESIISGPFPLIYSAGNYLESYINMLCFSLVCFLLAEDWTLY